MKWMLRNELLNNLLRLDAFNLRGAKIVKKDMYCKLNGTYLTNINNQVPSYFT